MTASRTPVTNVALLTNPAAGHGNGVDAARRAAARFAERGIRVTTLTGSSAGESQDLARQAVADGTDALVVVGGDGMMHLALPAVVGTSTPLGMIPAGTGNDQAREYGWPRAAAEAAADLVVDGVETAVDVGVAETADNERTYFSSVLASGFDSLVSDRTNRMRWPHGRARYNLALVAEFVNLRPLPVKVTVADGTVIEQDVLLVAVGNTKSYGGGMRICPGADPADGLFDVTIAGGASRSRAIGQLPSVYRGTHVDRDDVHTFRTPSLRIEIDAIDAYADGERVGPLPVDISLVPRGVNLIVPKSYPAS